MKCVATHYGLTDFALAGLSMGGAIAIGFALRYPDMVKALIPVDTWGVSEIMPFHHLSYWYVKHTDLTLTQYRWCAKFRWLAKWSISYALIGNKKLKMPVVYIIGEKDPLVPLSDINKAAGENPNSRVEVFEGCKHWSVKEQPWKFCRIVSLVFDQ